MQHLWKIELRGGHESPYICCEGSLIYTSDTQHVINTDCRYIKKALIFKKVKVSIKSNQRLNLPPCPIYENQESISFGKRPKKERLIIFSSIWVLKVLQICVSIAGDNDDDGHFRDHFKLGVNVSDYM